LPKKINYNKTIKPAFEIKFFQDSKTDKTGFMKINEYLFIKIVIIGKIALLKIF